MAQTSDQPPIFRRYVEKNVAEAPRDFSGLQQAAGDKFVQGVLLHDQDRVTLHSEKIRAGPVSLLWEMEFA